MFYRIAKIPSLEPRTSCDFSEKVKAFRSSDRKDGIKGQERLVAIVVRYVDEQLLEAINFSLSTVKRNAILHLVADHYESL